MSEPKEAKAGLGNREFEISEVKLKCVKQILEKRGLFLLRFGKTRARGIGMPLNLVRSVVRPENEARKLENMV